MVSHGVTSLSFDELVRDGLSSHGPLLTLAYAFLEIGRYSEQLARYRSCFPTAQIGVFRYEDFRDNAPATLAAIFASSASTPPSGLT